MDSIPVIDMEKVGLLRSEAEIDVTTLKDISDEIKKAFTSVGFCYMKNHGISKTLIESLFRASRDFFESPTEEKQKYRRLQDSYFGWMSPESEILNPKRPNDLKESFNYLPSQDTNVWPSKRFQKINQDMYKQCSAFAFRLMDILSIGLGLEKAHFKECHQDIGNPNNQTALRSLYYLPIETESEIKPGQIRCGEHTDYGTITMLFQDDIGGLEVNINGVGYVPATPIPDTIVVNIGSLMQRWTSDHLIATAHRVLIPEAELKLRQPRQSVAFFIQPNNETMITCLDGSDKYTPMTSRQYLDMRINETVY
ncbi:hypothetical protein ACF0H5_018207 [Mactra antiquata]